MLAHQEKSMYHIKDPVIESIYDHKAMRFDQRYRCHIQTLCFNLNEYQCMITRLQEQYQIEIRDIEHIVMDGAMCVVHYELLLTNIKNHYVTSKHIMKLLQFEEDQVTVKASWIYFNQCIDQEVLLSLIE